MQYVRVLTLAFAMSAAMVGAASAAPPIIGNYWSWEVTTTTAGLSMAVVMNDKPSQVYFTLGDDPNPVHLSPATIPAGRGGYNAHAQLRDLKPGVRYPWAAVATNSDGTTILRGDFRTDPAAGPAITVPVVKNVSYNGAVVSATISSVLGGSAFVQIGSNADMAGGLIEMKAQGFPRGDSGHSVDLTNFLKPGRAYFARVLATSAYGVSRSRVVGFTTTTGAAQWPTVRNPTQTNRATTAAFRVTLQNFGQPSRAYFNYGTSASLSGAKATPEKRLPGAATPVETDAAVADLTPGTTYYYQAVVVTDHGAAKSPILTFNTPAPAVGRVWSWNVESTTAGLSMAVLTHGMPARGHFRYGTSSALSGAAATAPDSIGIADGGINSHANLSGLTPGTTYYYQAILTTSHGDTKSGIDSFKTKP
jgi:hypothetical protein